MQINLLTFRIAQAMGYDQKDVFQRLSKLLEEQGELLEAFDLDDHDETIEEGVDNMLVITSIAYVIDPACMMRAEQVVIDAFKEGISMNANSQSLLTSYMISTGKMSDAIQKNRKVAASSYKGNVSDAEAVEIVFATLSKLCHFIASRTSDCEKVNALILKKNEKWLKKSLEGQGIFEDDLSATSLIRDHVRTVG